MSAKESDSMRSANSADAPAPALSPKSDNPAAQALLAHGESFDCIQGAPIPSGSGQFVNNAIQVHVDASAPELTGAAQRSVHSNSNSAVRATASIHSNLNPASAGSHIGELADVPPPKDGSMVEELQGLTTAQVEERWIQWGKNEIPEIDVPWYILLGKQFVGLMPFMLELAALLSAVIEDWPDFAIIMTMLLVNGLIGFHEEHKAKQSLDALKSQMTATVPCKRDGAVVITNVVDLVPDDIIFLRGGNIVPADSQWLEGDEMQVDTAALTGEPVPRKIPRPDREGEEEHAGKQLLSGCIIRQGEGHCRVMKTGLNTEIGNAAFLVQESSGHTMGVFEMKIMQVVKAVICVAIIDAGVLLYVQASVRQEEVKTSLLAVLAIVIGAVPIALPLVMQVTMAIGAGTMAKKKAIVTHLTALQEIASMTILCSDKTGTLTTANMQVMPSAIWTKPGCGHSQEDALIYSGVASNDANKEDPIDSSVLKTVYEYFGSEQLGTEKMAPYRKSKFVGFNPTTKRTVVYVDHPTRGQLKISKGLTSKVLCTGEDGGDCWEVENLAQIKEEVEEVDLQFSLRGYKTLGVTVQEGDGPMKFVAVVPMLDPPREDTMLTIYRIRQAFVGVKMITGDHLNIAVETSRLIGLGCAILPSTDLWPASAERDEIILGSDGFAQVLPKDKREVILVLQNKGLVVGMTGDGVNDAPALAQAQIGIAVDGATEAARSAADIILTTPGLSAIFDAVVESRKIFSRLRAYVLYRMAATIQIVVVLSVMIYGYDVVMNPLYVILLALLNDVSMLPIAQDNASASASPEIPSMPQILIASIAYGGMLTCSSLAFFEYARTSDWLDAAQHCDTNYNQGGFRVPRQGGIGIGGSDDCTYLDTLTYLQISIAIELIIFSCRAPGFILSPKYLLGDGAPSLALVGGVFSANILVTVLAAAGWVLTKIEIPDLLIIWGYDIGVLVAIDLVKVLLGYLDLPWMSAGAAKGVVGYPELPADVGGAPPGQSGTRSGAGASRSSIRSVFRSNLQGSTAGPGRSLMRSNASVDRSFAEPKAASMLPFPYNLRANAERNFKSF